MGETEPGQLVDKSDTNNKQTKPDGLQDTDIQSDRSSSVELKYQSSSAESIGRPASEKDEKKSSSTRSRSASRSSHSHSKISLLRKERDRVRSRRDRSCVNNFRRDRFNRFKYKRRDRVYRPFYIPRSPSPSDERRRRSRSTRSSEKRSGRKVESSEKKREAFSKKSDGKDNQLDKNLKPSDIKNSAKQTHQTFLAMLQEKKQKNQAFVSKPVIQSNEAKKIFVKIHGFVNTFNSLEKTALLNGKDARRLSSSNKSKKLRRKKKRRDTSSSSDSSPERKKKKQSDNLNSSREEGEIRSDSDESNAKPRKSKARASRKSTSYDSDSSEQSKRPKKTGKKRKSLSSSSDSSYSSDSSSTTSSSSSSPYSSDSDSSSSSSSSSSSGDSSSSDDRKKKVRRKKIKSKQKTKKVSNKRKEKDQHPAKAKVILEKTKVKKVISNELEGCENGLVNGSIDMFAQTSEMTLQSTASEPWPEQILDCTNTKPSLQFAINRKYASDIKDLSSDIATGTSSSLSFDRKIHILELKYGVWKSKDKNWQGFDGKVDTRVPLVGKMKGLNKANKNKIRQLLSQTQPIKLDMNSDYNYYYHYYGANVFPYVDYNDSQSVAQYIAHYQMFNSYDYTQQQLSEWASKQGFNLIETNKYDMGESSVNTYSATNGQETKQDGRIEVITTNQVSSRISSEIIKSEPNYRIMNGIDECDSPPMSPPPARPKMTFLEAVEPITLPNGITLPVGTKQIIVHPYNRPIY